MAADNIRAARRTPSAAPRPSRTAPEGPSHVRAPNHPRAAASARARSPASAPSRSWSPPPPPTRRSGTVHRPGQGHRLRQRRARPPHRPRGVGVPTGQRERPAPLRAQRGAGRKRPKRPTAEAERLYDEVRDEDGGGLFSSVAGFLKRGDSDLDLAGVAAEDADHARDAGGARGRRRRDRHRPEREGPDRLGGRARQGLPPQRPAGRPAGRPDRRPASRSSAAPTRRTARPRTPSTTAP